MSNTPYSYQNSFLQEAWHSRHTEVQEKVQIRTTAGSLSGQLPSHQNHPSHWRNHSAASAPRSYEEWPPRLLHIHACQHEDWKCLWKATVRNSCICIKEMLFICLGFPYIILLTLLLSRNFDLKIEIRHLCLSAYPDSLYWSRLWNWREAPHHLTILVFPNTFVLTLTQKWV